MLADGRDVIVSRDRVAGANAIAARNIHDVILMDDGLQNPFWRTIFGLVFSMAALGSGTGVLFRLALCESVSPTVLPISMSQ